MQGSSRTAREGFMNVLGLDSVDLLLTRAALTELSREKEPCFVRAALVAQDTLERGEELTCPHRRIVALALQGYAMHHGVVAFAGIISVSRKIGIEAELRMLLEEWLRFVEERGKATAKS